ncbi:hypothetical protein [Streptomyces sp. NPDC059168]|uniref:hypothetical protein n=1 Tax=Streptomyces sp. NPDC059168 TaxID=3346753 RepID=UPI00369181EC
MRPVELGRKETRRGLQDLVGPLEFGVLLLQATGGQVKTYKDNTATGGPLLAPVKTYSLNWSSAKWILTNGTRILVIGADGTTDVYNQSNPATGDGTTTKVMDDLKASVTRNCQDLWMRSGWLLAGIGA